MKEDACIERLGAWIIEIKRDIYRKNINPENPENAENPEDAESLFAYKRYLEDLEGKLSRAISNEDNEALTSLDWPNELMGCITDMRIRSEILDHLKQAFTINHFNKSPKHEIELQKAKQW